METVYIGIGSNVGEPKAQVESAIDALDALPGTGLKARSRLYASRALGPVSQPDFVNAVARIETGLAPHELIEALHAIERAHGRVRDGTRWGPRRLDLDILLYGDRSFDEGGLKVPHPELTRRSFVLYPLAEVAPGLVVPGAGPLDELLAKVPADDLEPLA